MNHHPVLFNWFEVIFENVGLKRRFPILQHPLRISAEKWPKVILACFILHNISIHLEDPLEEGWLLLPEEPVPVDGRLATTDQALFAAGRRARDNKAQQMFLTRGG